MSLDSSYLMLKDLSYLTKNPLEIVGKNFSEKFPAKHGVRVNDSFFFKDGCEICGRCCVNEENVWTESTIAPFFKDAENHKEDYIVDEIDFPFEVKMSLVDEFKSSLETREVFVNGKSKTLWISVRDKNGPIVTFTGKPKRKAQRRCRWLNSGEDHTIGEHWCKCKIHPYRSVTCRIPHIRIKQSSDGNYGILGVQEYGRNWQLGCPVKFKPEIDEDDIRSKINTLTVLKQYADDLEIETYLPEVIRYLEEGGRTGCLIENNVTKKLI